MGILEAVFKMVWLVSISVGQSTGGKKKHGPTVQTSDLLIFSNCIHILGLWRSDVSFKHLQSYISIKRLQNGEALFVGIFRHVISALPFCRFRTSQMNANENIFHCWLRGFFDVLFGGQISCGWHSSEDLAQNGFDMV